MSGPKRTFIGGGSGGGGGGGGATDLEGLSDVDLTNPADNQVLTYNGTVWVNDDIPEIEIPEVEGFSWAGHWDSATAYDAGDLVDRSGSVWRALTGSQDSDPADPPSIQNVAGSTSSGNGSSTRFYTIRFTPTADITANILQVGIGGSGNVRVGIAEDFSHTDGFNEIEEFPWVDDVDGNPAFVDGIGVSGTAIDFPLAANLELQEDVTYQFVMFNLETGHKTWTSGGRSLTGAVDGASGDTGTLGFHADPGIYELTSGQGAYPKWLLRYDAATWEELFALDAPHDHDDDYEAAGAVATHAGTAHGSTNLEGLSDVDLTTPAEDQVLTYDGSQWVNADPAGGGGGGDLTWTALPTLQGGWGPAGGGANDGQYAKDSNNVVHLRGYLANGATGLISTLPEGARPQYHEFFMVYTEGGADSTGLIKVETDGEVRHLAGGTSRVSLSGITFSAAPA